jgi:hypothetical protein
MLQRSTSANLALSDENNASHRPGLIIGRRERSRTIRKKHLAAAAQVKALKSICVTSTQTHNFLDT